VVISAALAQIFRLPPSREALRRTAHAAAEGGKAEATGVQGGVPAAGVQGKATARTQTESRSLRLQAEETGYLLLDEPTASLDLGYQLEVVSLLKRLHEERRVAIVISTHDLGLAGSLCDTLVLIRDGVVVASGPTDEVLTAANVRMVYGVEADVIRHPSGQRVVVPVRRTGVQDRG
jgi:ABC-type histidine transport system ATPase subunit